MKTLISFLTAALIVGFIFFGIFYWGFHKEFREAFVIAISAALGGFIVDYVRERKKNNFINRDKLEA